MTCKHPNVPVPEFDEAQASKMTTEEIRRRYPRGYQVCPDCGKTVISYASRSHYYYGDY